MNKRGKLICFEGLDGAGKTTIAKRTVNYFLRHNDKAIFVEKKHPEFQSQYLTQHMATLKSLLWEYDPEAPLHEVGDSHWLYLMSSWFCVLDKGLVQPLLDQGRLVVVDNWYYKFISRFFLKAQLNSSHVEDCFRSLSVPDCVVLLDVSPDVAASRKKKFTVPESGNLDGLHGRTRENFIKYQDLMHQILLEFQREKQWAIIKTDHLSEDEVVRCVIEELINRNIIELPLVSDPPTYKAVTKSNTKVRLIQAMD
jgi:dTMP kinase